MEFRLGRIVDNFPTEDIKIELLDLISEDEFKRLDDAISEIQEFSNIERLYLFVERNESDLIDYLKAANNELVQVSISWNSVKKEHIEEVFLEANRLFLNYLSSIKTFIDHSESNIKRKFGKDAEECKNYKDILAFYYDNSFAYRFFYKLRNYAQHVGLPINDINYSHKYHREENLIEGTLTIEFNKKELLDKFDSWGTIKVELESSTKPLYLTILIVEMTANLELLEKFIKNIYKNHWLNACSYLLQAINHIKKSDENIQYFIADNFKDKPNGELKSFGQRIIPLGIIERIIEELSGD